MTITKSFHKENKMIEPFKQMCLLLLGCFMIWWGHLSVFAEDKPPIKWETITVLNLETAQWIALAENANIQAIIAKIGQANAQAQQAKAAYWPKLNLSADAARTRLSNSEYRKQLTNARLINPMATMDNVMKTYGLNLSVSYALFDGFLSKYQYLSAVTGHEISKVQYQNAKRLLLQQVANLFFRAQLARENVAIAEANIHFYQQKLDEAEARHEAGSGSLSDALNFQVQLNSARTTLIQANESYQLVLLDLAESLGISYFSDQVTLSQLETEKEKDLAQPEVKEYLKHANSLRPDIVLYQKMIDQAKHQEKAAKANFFPSIHVNGVYQGARPDDYQWEKDNFGNMVSVNMTYPIFAGGYYWQKIKQTSFQIKEATKTYQYIQKSIEIQVRQAIEQVKAAQEEVQLQRDNAILVQRNRDLVEKEYAAGQNSLVRLNEAQRDLITAKSRSAAALVSLYLAWQNLLAETGQILMAFE